MTFISALYYVYIIIIKHLQLCGCNCYYIAQCSMTIASHSFSYILHAVVSQLQVATYIIRTCMDS